MSDSFRDLIAGLMRGTSPITALCHHSTHWSWNMVLWMLDLITQSRGITVNYLSTFLFRKSVWFLTKWKCMCEHLAFTFDITCHSESRSNSSWSDVWWQQYATSAVKWNKLICSRSNIHVVFQHIVFIYSHLCCQSIGLILSKLLNKNTRKRTTKWTYFDSSNWMFESAYYSGSGACTAPVVCVQIKKTRSQRETRHYFLAHAFT